MNNNPLGVWKFSKDAINKMKEISGKTKEIERGANISYDIRKNNHILEIDNICKGTKCEIHIPNKQNKNMQPIGFFHTHPKHKEPNPSCGDMLNLKRQRVMCIGTPNKKLSCFVINPELKEIDIISEEIALGICHKNSMKLRSSEGLKSEIADNLEAFTDAIQKRFTKKFNPEDYTVK